ncbi:MAG: tripartite tricarboxylate transporter substrate binding protein [Curvibacter lanceolatus]|jgi:tripartite-type tricarboxylate transporter receptor subunit TctC|uniref:Bug family tripartite tricarboxylate transporter substrate binding protein n=1 Tax=Curvibacter lanceolatus TaxID=86182 RepID=UPI00036A8E90|nr:tripartite tricarboxylate transporter substrate binding protein [Curvibacter lanceolatus]MBV5293744.1 tripartite tricarboxylate transporter substrate binding protein [Curvibacter lanceolatus]
MNTESPLSLRRRALWPLLSTLGALTALAPLAQAEGYPDKPVTLVVGYPAGGSTDLMARTIGPELSRRLGTPVVIENLGGAGGAIGAQKVASAAADGYTLLVGANNEIAIKRLVAPASVKYELRDFTPLGLIASQPMVLVASPRTGVKTVADFMKQVKANPGKFTYGSSGVGTALHLAGEMIKDQGGLFMTHIPYRGVAPLTTDLLGSNVDYGVFVLSSGLPLIKSGKLLALGTTERKRSQATPDVPAVAETPALKNIDISSWFALLGPARLPEPVAARLKKALAETLQAPEVRKKLEETGSTVANPQLDLARFMAEESAKYKRIVEFARIEE